MHEGGVAHRAKDIKKKRIMERKNAKKGAKGPKPRPGSATQVSGTLAVPHFRSEVIVLAITASASSVASISMLMQPGTDILGLHAAGEGITCS